MRIGYKGNFIRIQSKFKLLLEILVVLHSIFTNLFPQIFKDKCYVHNNL